MAVNAMHSLGRHKEEAQLAQVGLERAERVLKLHPENSDPALLGACALATLGQHERAREWADRALAIDPDDPQAQYNVACVYSLIGAIEPAFDILEKVLPKLSAEFYKWFRNDSDLDPIRAHPRYENLLKLIG